MTCQVHEYFNVLPSSVKYLENGLVGQQLEKWGKVDAVGLGVDGHGFGWRTHLYETKARPIGLFSHEFGVNGDVRKGRGALAESGEF